MKLLNKEFVLKDLNLMRDCADGFCPDHDCKHCKLGIDQDEKVAVLDIAKSVMDVVLNQTEFCPLSQSPCFSKCAWYDCVKECCVMKRR